VALAESCFNPGGSLGASIDLQTAGIQRLDQVLFNETQSRIVISTMRENVVTVLQFMQSRNLPAHRLGTVGGDELRVVVANETLLWPLREIHDDWYDAIANAIRGELTTS